jgi:arylsulfatase A-like enzyme
VFTADHGEELFERHAYIGHSKSVYEPVLHVPLILRHPESMAPDQRIEDLVGLEDLAPTFLELLQIPAPPGMHGASLAPLLRGGARDARTAFGVWNDRIFTARDTDWRLVWNPDRIEPDDAPPGSYPIPEVALFAKGGDDPTESVDVSQAHPEVVGRLQREILGWMRELDRCTRGEEALTPERMEALEAMGYAGSER